MGTRGLLGFVIDDIVKASYSQFDSYPSGLGVDVANWAKGVIDWGEVADQVRNLTVVDEGESPAAEQANRLAKFTDSHVSTGDDWYSTLRNCQGDPAAILESGFILDSVAFAKDSLFCEWAYIVNLDTQVIEIYQGFQKEVHSDGRFASEEGMRGYYPVRLVRVFDIDDSEIAKEMVDLENSCYEDDEV